MGTGTGTRAVAQEWSIQEVARLTGVTSRTLRHYDSVGLLAPSSVGDGGVRRYGRQELLRLQRILVLRDLGVPLATIRDAVGDVGGPTSALAALREHREQLRREADRLARQVASVERTITALEEGGPLVAEEMFDGFDHSWHREEVERRWGAQAYADGDAWWRGLGEDGRREWQERSADLGRDWAEAASSGADPAGERGQRLAARHVGWMGSIPGTPGHGGGRPDPGYVLGLADMYVADPRFAAHYGGEAGATFVRDALRVHVAAW
ncbi:MerR family transcriptional regulator [Actinotalea sp. Marseille-Q4924]|uniref:MerR family transcriptional regulator n=1 Tax=Actinotalea sp. Marseille-Q4924 TaxID=2866571 RepID=UPI001CE3DE8B|nr:MerR family transcriptional regulator [Actinotalea sp. Marseille-Q4924]